MSEHQIDVMEVGFNNIVAEAECEKLFVLGFVYKSTWEDCSENY